nr:ATP-binding cassette sub-family A member 3-like [Microcebus murinus]XP_012645595.1 ATP-binding cassette sub-family A member 3-like [Microcebus murinus]XP_012645596.1 ATP-binding cassette sub-family A member 3-like [Microcebus murinus]XP_012645598.1 ATP-binding cassette sub-family A member 3-like [Microcebus murinus]XP_012645599.1 ATP-binding cassette sub-family A member 3-like [Microcebus murinus]
MDSLWFRQFVVLIWKNLLLKRRNTAGLLVDIGLVFVVSALLLIGRRVIKKEFRHASTFDPLPLTLPAFLINTSVVYELVYVPSESDVAKNITEMVKRDLNANFKVRGFSSEEAFEKYIKYKYKNVHVLAAIVFDHNFKNSNDRLPLKVKYRLRFSNFSDPSNHPYKLFQRKTEWHTSILFPRVPTLGPRNPDEADGGHPGYIKEGFLVIQHSLDKAIMIYHNGRDAERMFNNASILAQRFPYPAYYHDNHMWLILNILSMMVLLAFSQNELTLIRIITLEKERGLKEYQLVAGLKNWMLWATYFVTALLLCICITSVLHMALFLKIAQERVIQHSDPTVTAIFFLCFIIASILFAFMISTFFNRAAFAVAFGGFLYFLNLPYVIISGEYIHAMSLRKKLFPCLFLNTALRMGIDLLIKMEMKGYGVRWNNLFSPVSPDDNLTFAHIMGMFLIDAFLYGLVAWYVDSVFPGKYGVPKPWYFFLQVSSNASIIGAYPSPYVLSL